MIQAVCLALMLLASPQDDQARPLKTMRVQRLVLNDTPRIAVARLKPTMWAAYDTTEARLAWVWIGTINWNGWMFNGARGQNPTIQADRLLYEAKSEQVWTVQQGESKFIPEVRFKGYDFGDEVVHFHSVLILPDQQRIELRESISQRETEEGEIVVQRRLEFVGIPDKTKLIMPLVGNAPWDRFEILGTGDGKVDRETWTLTQKRDGYDICSLVWNK